jgi:hypothetical protein
MRGNWIGAFGSTVAGVRLVFGFSSVLLTANTFDGNGDTKRKAERTPIAPRAASR